MKVSDCNIGDEYLLCQSNENIVEISNKIRNYKRFNNVIVLEAKKPVGIISMRDIIERVVADQLDPKKITAKDIMTTPLAVVEISDDLRKVAELMASRSFLSLPVVNDKEEFSGVISIYDVLGKLKGE